MKAGSGGAWADSKVLSEKIFLVDCSSGQLAASPVVPRQSGVGGSRSRAFGGMCAEMLLPSSCSSSFGMYSTRLCALAMIAASGTWPISAMIFTRSSTLPSISALWNLDMMSFRISAIFSIFRSFVMLPVIKYKKDKASKFLVFWYTISTICWLPWRRASSPRRVQHACSSSSCAAAMASSMWPYSSARLKRVCWSSTKCKATSGKPFCFR
mmetsp:Transcript_50646/g.133752  ORF Transcript_50646/g.133752 Transcript_50646/m.133752 type:complete len:211 (-) Transcript_50646:2091-2723(-)